MKKEVHMNREEKALLAALAAFIKRDNLRLPADLDWSRLYRLAKAHAVAPILYRSLRSTPEIVTDAQMMQEFGRAYDEAIFLAVRQQYEMDGILTALNQKKIPHILLKGCYLMQFYPVRELRTMSDIDILVPPKYHRAAGRALEELGFSLGNQEGNTWNYRRNVVEIELHSSLSEGRYWHSVDAEEYFKGCFQHTVEGALPYTRYLTPEYHFVYMIFHLAKHFEATGAGVRMFLDVAVCMDRFREEMDWDLVFRELRKLKLDGFFRRVMLLVSVWFHVRPVRADRMALSEDELRAVTRYVLEGGVYGMEKRDLGTIILRRGVKRGRSNGSRQIRMRALWGYLFPERAYMRRYLKAVDRTPLLLPAAWAIRCWEGLFRRRKSTLAHLRQLQSGTGEALRQDHILEAMGL